MPAHAAAAAHVLWLPQHRTLTRLLRAAPQIRLHLAHAGHAILGDDLYGVTGGRTAEKHLPGCCICLWPCCRWQVQGLISHSRSASLLAAFYRLSLLPKPPPAWILVQAPGLGGMLCTLRPCTSPTLAPASRSPCGRRCRQISWRPCSSWACGCRRGTKRCRQNAM